MSNIRSRHTKPERIVRSIIHSLGFRFRIHYRKLIGKPDVVLPRHKKIVLIHGCFWHMHDCKRGNVTPKTNIEYWQMKRIRNVERDRDYLKTYTDSDYRSLTIWECETKNIKELRGKLSQFLES